MNSTAEREGRALIQAWKKASALISIEFSSATHSSFVERRGRITTFDERRIVVAIDASEELAVDLTGAVFAEVASVSLELTVPTIANSQSPTSTVENWKRSGHHVNKPLNEWIGADDGT